LHTDHVTLGYQVEIESKVYFIDVLFRSLHRVDKVCESVGFYVVVDDDDDDDDDGFCLKVIETISYMFARWK